MRRPLLLVALVAAALLAFLLWPRAVQAPDTARPIAVEQSGQPALPARRPPAHAPPARLTAGAEAAPPVDAGIAQRDADGGGAQSPGLFGPLVALGQNLSFGEALQKNAANADEYVDRLCADSAALREHPPMKALDAGERDAAAFMADLIDYEKPLDQPPGKLHLPDDLVQRLAAPPGVTIDWGARITDADLAPLDFSWLSSLARFDHWTVLGAGRLRDYPANDFFSTPIPNYVSLMQWSKLRFALARRRGDHLAASAEVRTLAALLRTQGMLISEMVAAGLYKIDAAARASAAAAGADVTGWPLADLDGLERYRRLAFASMYFTYPGVKPETLRKAMACTNTPCPSLIEGAGANRAFGSFGSDNLAVVRELAAKYGCEPAMLERAVRTDEIHGGKGLEVFGDDLGEQIPRRFASH